MEKECEEKVKFNIIKKPKVHLIIHIFLFPGMVIIIFVMSLQHLVSVDWLDGDEMVIVSVCPLKLAESYPPAFDRKRFVK